jgi:MFS family permease
MHRIPNGGEAVGKPSTNACAESEVTTGFWKAGHRPTLLAAFFYFDLSFMVWVLLGPLGVNIAKDLGLSPAQKGLMVAVPVLAGALLRIVNGLLVDRIGPKKTGLLGQLIVIAGLGIAWATGINSYGQVLALGLVLGVAGSALPWRSRWRRAGIRRSIRAPRSASPGRAIRAPCSPRCSRRRSPRYTAGRM